MSLAAKIAAKRKEE
jgi:hypothetical protein